MCKESMNTLEFYEPMLYLSTPEHPNTMWRKALYAKMDQLPLEMKLGIMAKSAGSPRWTLSVSYANSRSFGPLDPCIEELYMVAEPGVSDIICEIACINHSFFLSLCQNFSSEAFAEVFLSELAAVGIDYEVTGREPLRPCGLAAYGTMPGAENTTKQS